MKVRRIRIGRIRKLDDFLFIRFASRDKAELKVLSGREDIQRDPSDLARMLIREGMKRLKQQDHESNENRPQV